MSLGIQKAPSTALSCGPRGRVGHSVRSRQGSHASCPHSHALPCGSGEQKAHWPQVRSRSFSHRPFPCHASLPDGPQPSPERRSRGKVEALKTNSSTKATEHGQRPKHSFRTPGINLRLATPQGLLLKKNQQPGNHRAHEHPAPEATTQRRDDGSACSVKKLL